MKFTEDQLRSLHSGAYVSEYEKKGRGYHRTRLTRLIPRLNLQSTDVVADFGCGNGLLVPLIYDKVAHYYGVDFSREFIERAQARVAAAGIHNATLVRAEITDFCAGHVRTFDKAFAFDLAEHLYDDTWVEIASAIRSSLRPGGALFIHTPNGWFFLEILKKRGILRQFPEHVAVRTAEENIRILQRAGFVRIHVSYLSHYHPLLSPAHCLSGAPGIGKYLRARLFIECRT